jgi:hypothetical protein
MGNNEAARSQHPMAQLLASSTSFELTSLDTHACRQEPCYGMDHHALTAFKTMIGVALHVYKYMMHVVSHMDIVTMGAAFHQP